MDKKKIRAEISALKTMMDPNDLEYLANRIKDSFCSLDVYKAAKTVYAYIDTESEASTRGIISQAIADGKKLAAPRLVNDEYIEFVRFSSLDDFAPDFRGIPEPVGEETANDKSALILVPGLAFDYDLNRIGTGGGFYDKYLSMHKDIQLFKVALAYDFQIFKRLDVIEPHDVKLDLIVTPTMVIGS